MVLGFAVLCLSAFASLTMTSPAVLAWEERHEARETTRPESHVIVLDTIEIVGRVPVVVETLRSHEEYTVGTTHIVADGEAIIYASR